MNKYVEHIINDLVRDTRIDYDQDRIYYPPHFALYLTKPFITLHPSSSFSNYCKERYGLTQEEIEYVWDQYKIIIKDKIRNNE